MLRRYSFVLFTCLFVEWSQNFSEKEKQLRMIRKSYWLYLHWSPFYTASVAPQRAGRKLELKGHIRQRNESRALTLQADPFPVGCDAAAGAVLFARRAETATVRGHLHGDHRRNIVHTVLKYFRVKNQKRSTHITPHRYRVC